MKCDHLLPRNHNTNWGIQNPVCPSQWTVTDPKPQTHLNYNLYTSYCIYLKQCNSNCFSTNWVAVGGRSILGGVNEMLRSKLIEVRASTTQANHSRGPPFISMYSPNESKCTRWGTDTGYLGRRVATDGRFSRVWRSSRVR